MKIEYIRNLNGSYMIIRDVDYPCRSYELMMLLNNRIPGLLSLQIIVGDGKLEYWYDITGMTSLDTQLMLISLDASGLQTMTEDIFDMNLGLEEYLLDGKNICYLPELVFYDRYVEKYRFCYLPGSGEAEPQGMQNLMEYLLTKIDHTDQRAVKIGYELYEKSTQEGCSIQELLGCLGKEETVDVLGNLETGAGSEIKQISTDKSDETEENKYAKAAFEKNKRSNKKWKPKKEKKGKLDYAAELKQRIQHQIVAEPVVHKKQTVLLDRGRHHPEVWLRYQGKGEEQDFPLGSGDFLIGTQEDRVDFVMQADTVSHIHARITGQDGTFYLEDLNSTNGTCVNGKELVYHEKVKLKPEDRILFADEEYIVRR